MSRLSPLVFPSRRPPVRPVAPGPYRAAATGLSLPALPGHDSPPYFRTAAVDTSGKVYDGAAARLLGWCPGDRVVVTVVGSSVVCTSGGQGTVAGAAGAYLTLPAHVRARCGIRAGSRVLLVADPGLGVLVVHSASAVGSMLAAFHTHLARGDHRG